MAHHDCMDKSSFIHHGWRQSRSEAKEVIFLQDAAKFLQYAVRSPHYLPQAIKMWAEAVEIVHSWVESRDAALRHEATQPTNEYTLYTHASNGYNKMIDEAPSLTIEWDVWCQLVTHPHIIPTVGGTSLICPPPNITVQEHDASKKGAESRVRRWEAPDRLSGLPANFFQGGAVPTWGLVEDGQVVFQWTDDGTLRPGDCVNMAQFLESKARCAGVAFHTSPDLVIVS